MFIYSFICKWHLLADAREFHGREFNLCKPAYYIVRCTVSWQCFSWCSCFVIRFFFSIFVAYWQFVQETEKPRKTRRNGRKMTFFMLVSPKNWQWACCDYRYHINMINFGLFFLLVSFVKIQCDWLSPKCGKNAECVSVSWKSVSKTASFNIIPFRIIRV